MALLNLVRASTLLANQVSVAVALPDQVRGPLRTLWLLHGLGDNGSAWQRKTAIEQLAIDHDLAIVMPDMGRSFYMNTATHTPYWDYLTQELIPQMRALLPLDPAPAANVVAGNSMGGFGALRLAATYPEWFSAVIAISPVVDLSVVPSIMPDHQAVFGPQVPGELLFQTLAAADPAALRRLRWYHAIGDADFMKAANDRFDRFAADLGLPLTCRHTAGGHDWHYWRGAIQDALTWLDQPGDDAQATAQTEGE